MVRHFRKRKSCWHVIAIPQAGIAALTLTVMQGFEAQKRLLRTFPFPFLRSLSIFHMLPFQAFVTEALVEPGCDGWKANVLTTRLRQSIQCSVKMLYLNQSLRKRQ